MSDPLREFIVGQGLSTDPDKPGARTPRLSVSGGIPIRATAFFEELGVPFGSQFEQLPRKLQADLAALEPAVQKLGPKFNYNRLLELAEKGKDKLDPDIYFKMMGVATLGLSKQSTQTATASKEALLVASNEFARQQTFGIVPAIPEETLENLTLDPQGVAVAKAVGGIAGVFMAGKLIVSALSKTTLLPKAGPVIEQIPTRVKEILLGVGTGAILDAARPDGLPEDPAAIDISARLAHPIADILGGGEAAERVALGLAGAGTGGAIGAALLPVFRGIQRSREAKVFNQLDDATAELIRTRLQEAGVAVEKGETKQALVAKLFSNLDKVSQSERLAAISAADETRMDFILSQLYTDPAFNGSDDLRYMAGVFRANPGGLSVVKGVTDPQAAKGLVAQMGLNVVGMKVKDGILIMRPQVVFPERGVVTAKIQRQLDDFTDLVRATSKGKPSTRLSILPDGTVVKGDYSAAELVSRYKLKAPQIEGQANYDIAVREHLGMMDIRVGEGGAVTVQLPSLVTQSQARVLGKMVDKGIPEIKIISTLKERVVSGPYIGHGDREFRRTKGVGGTNLPQGRQVLASREGMILSQPIATHSSLLPRGFYWDKHKVPRGATRPGEVADPYIDNYVIFGPEAPGSKRVIRWAVGLTPNDAMQQALDRGMSRFGLTQHVMPPGPTSATDALASTQLVSKEVTLKNPFGMQVEDALAGLVRGASKPKITADVVKKVQQYQKEGVFRGQAGVLPDGYPVEILRRVGKKIAYRDPITGKIHRIDRDNIAVLPTSLEGELAPSRQIFEAMDDVEKALFAKLRRGVNEGLAKPITTLRELESFAAARGKLVSSLGRGRVRIFDPNTGESKVFDNIKAATASVRETLGPLPDLTPPEIEELLGFKPNLGYMGTGGPAARFHEPIPITEDEFVKAAETGTLGMLPPGLVDQFYTPTKGLMTNLSQKYGMPFDKVFENLQSGVVHRQNFVAAWIEGRGPGLPQDAMPLLKIYKMAGKPDEGRQRLFTAWLESEGDDVARKAIEGQMKSHEVAAAKELRKWYGVGPENGLFKALDVEAEFLTSYAPHLREQAEGFGGNIREAWRISRGTPLPKSVDFFADFVRDGNLDIYEERAFVAAARYVEAGARARFLNRAMDDAKRLLRAIPDNAVKAPLVNYIEALKGTEFSAQRAALDASFTNLLNSLGASEKVARDVGERLSMALLGLSYQATMAFRPGLAIRNAAQIFQTGWPLLGGVDDTFAEAIGRALTVAGRNEAIQAGAVSIKQSAIFAGDEAMAALPGWLRGMSDTGFKLYDGADVFTRSVTFHAGKLRTEKAIASFGEALRKGKDMKEAQKALIRESGAMVLHKTFVDEFLRKVATSPDDAAKFIGKQMADITQFLYGRGNQPRWMRTVPGRFFGQFGTWPLWYIDYVKRSFGNMWRNGYQKEAMKFLGKIALVDLAIFETGRRANLDLRRWMAGNAMFGVPPLGQPPAVNLLYGTAQLSRGLSEAVLGTYDSPANKQRLAIARQTLAQTGLAFVPNLYAVRDIGRLVNAGTPTEALAAALATRPSSEFTIQHRLDLLFDPGKMSTDLDLEQAGEVEPTAVNLMLKGMSVQRDRIIVPQGNLPAQPPGATPTPTPQGGSSITKVKASVSGRPPMEPSALPESIRTGESTPRLE